MSRFTNCYDTCGTWQEANDGNNKKKQNDRYSTTLTTEQKEAIENEINNLSNVNPNGRNRSNMIYYAPLYNGNKTTVEPRNKGNSAIITSSNTLGEPNSKKLRKSPVATDKRKEHIDVDLDCNENISRHISTKKPSVKSIESIKISSSSNAIPDDKSNTNPISTVARKERSVINAKTTTNISKFTSGLLPQRPSHQIEEMLKDIQESVKQVITEQSKLQETLVRLEVNQERIMDRMSLGTMSMISADVEPSTRSTNTPTSSRSDNEPIPNNFQQNDRRSEKSSVNYTNNNNKPDSTNSVTTTDISSDTVNQSLDHASSTGEENHDESALIEQVTEQLVKFLVEKNKIEFFQTILILIFEKNTRPACLVNLLNFFFTKEEMLDTWYGPTSVQPKKMLDPKRVSLIKEVTLIRFPPKPQEWETRKKILLKMNCIIRNKCRYIHNKYHQNIKNETDPSGRT